MEVRVHSAGYSIPPDNHMYSPLMILLNLVLEWQFIAKRQIFINIPLIFIDIIIIRIIFVSNYLHT